MDKRAQLEGFDVIVGLFIFLLLFTFVSTTWQEIFNLTERGRQLERLKLKAVELSDQLALSPGMPGNWQIASDYNKIGLSVKPRKIGLEKLNAMQNADYNALKTKMNIEGNDYWVRITMQQQIVFEKGMQRERSLSAKVERIVSYQNNPALLSVIIYE